MLKQYTGFDHENVLKPSTPIRVNYKGRDEEYSYYALIIVSNPLALKVVRENGCSPYEVTIRVDEVQSGKYTIEPLVYQPIVDDVEKCAFCSNDAVTRESGDNEPICQDCLDATVSDYHKNSVEVK